MGLYRGIQSGLVLAGVANKGNAGWFQIAGTMRKAGNSEVGAGDGAMTRLETKQGRTAVTLAEAMDFSDVRLERVARLRAAIASGSYVVSASALADRMSAKLFGGTKAPKLG